MNPMNPPVRLGQDNYQKGQQTITQSLNSTEIAEKLANYQELKKGTINDIPLNTHVRYFSWNPKTQQYQFRLGGFLRRNNDPRYVVLSTEPVGGKTWSVQTSIAGKKTAFFYLKDKVEREVDNRTAEIIELYEQSRKQLKQKTKELEECKKSNSGTKVSKKILKDNPHGQSRNYRVENK